jgi:DNA-binding MarR family transcriptional regulator
MHQQPPPAKPAKPAKPAGPGEQRVGPDFVEEYPWSEPSATEAVLNIVRTAGLLLAEVAAVTQRYGLSPAGMNVLTILEHAPEPLSPRVIAEALIVTSSTVTGLLDSLEKRGFIRRSSHPSDRRMLLIEITDAGSALMRDLGEPLVRSEMEWLSCLTAREQERLIGLLGRVQHHVAGRAQGRRVRGL